jgi:hypothetical protein
MLFFKSSHLKKKQVTTALFVGTGVVLYWRGIWGLADLLLFPTNEFISYTISTLVGIVILYFTHYLIEELL